MGKWHITNSTALHHSFAVAGTLRVPLSQPQNRQLPWRALSEKEGLQPVYTITDRTPATGYPITEATVMPDWTMNGYRLPTEVQWQYAAQGGFSAEVTVTNVTGWYSANSNNTTHEVGQKEPNAFGLNDRLGNVWEWCWDWYGNTYPSSAVDPSGTTSGFVRVIRGGSWNHSAEYVRSAWREHNNPYMRWDTLGFRLVRPCQGIYLLFASAK